MPPTTIPARQGSYAKLLPGQTITLINTHGTQVIDFWAFTPPPPLALSPSPSSAPPPSQRSFVRSAPSPAPTSPTVTPYPFATGIQYLSMSRTRSVLMKLVPSATTHDTLYSNKSVPLLTLLEDTTPYGIHDTLFGCCDRFRYHNLAGLGYDVPADYEHASCAENLHVQLQVSGLGDYVSDEWTPDPLNVFMNVPVSELGDQGSGNDAKGGVMRSEPPGCEKGGRLVLRAETEVWCYMSACPNDVIKGVNVGVCREAEFEVGEA